MPSPPPAPAPVPPLPLLSPPIAPPKPRAAKRAAKRTHPESADGGSDREAPDSDADPGAPFFCPFPACSKARANFSGWKTRAAIMHHVDHDHVGHTEVPPRSWLTLAQRWVCCSCLKLVPLGRPCVTDDCRPATLGEDPYRADMPHRSPFSRPTFLPAPPAGTSLQAPPPAGLQDALDLILSFHTPLLRHVPKSAMAAWGAALARRISNLASCRTWESLLDLMAFPKLTLEAPGRKLSPEDLTNSVLTRLSTLESQGTLSTILALRSSQR